MRHAAALLAVLVLGAACAGGQTLCRTWGPAGDKVSFPGTLKLTQAGTIPILTFDLSAIPKGAKVHHTSLYCFTRRGLQPTQPARLLPVARLPEGQDPVCQDQPLALEEPWCRSFDATEAVRKWVADPGANLGLAVAGFEGLEANRSCLKVLYDGKGGDDLPPQVEGLRAVHHDGQTFIVWKEHPAFRPKPEDIRWVEQFDEKEDKYADGPGPSAATGLQRIPVVTLKTLRDLKGLSVRDTPSGFQGIKPITRLREVPAVRYRVYRHNERITAADLPRAELLGEVEPCSAYDEKWKTITFQGEYINQQEIPTCPIPTYCIEDGKAVLPGEALYVHTPAAPGKAFYAVTMVLGGTENVSQISDANSLAGAMEEKPAPPAPVLQFIQNDQYVAETPERWYMYWAAPPYYNLPDEPFHVTVGLPRNLKTPAAMHIAAPSMGGDFNLRGDMNVPSRTAITLMIEQHIPWGTDLCFSEGRSTLKSFQDSKVRYFSERYMSHLISWARSQWSVDPANITGSMLHFGIRHPEIFTRMDFGAYTAGYDMRYNPGSGSLPALLGPQGVKTEDGEDAWAAFSVAWYVNRYPARDIPYLICISAVGKDVGHTSEFGWQDDPRGWAGLLKARQTFVATWGSEQGRAWFLHPEMQAAFQKMRWDVSIPAFANCSLDNNPGNGDPADGDACGQINGYLLWEDAGQVDRNDAWEMTVYLVPGCPRDACTVDITPRHCKAFKPKAGEKFKWTNTSLADNKPSGGGDVTADANGLVTIEKVTVTKGRNRIRISR